MQQGTLGFLGCGNMGFAILSGLLRGGVLAPDQVLIYDPSAERVNAAAAQGVAVAITAAELATQSDTLLLAVKPQAMAEALAPLREVVRPNARILSIAAGLTVARLQAMLRPDCRIIRVMPNTPALVGAGATGIALGANCTEDDAAYAEAIFAAVGVVERIDEPEMDALTALSGSGPAYFFRIVECLVDASVAQGLSYDQALRLARHTLLGAGRLLVETGESPEELRRKVTSPGGTTAAALAAFEAEGLPHVLGAGIGAAIRRSRELAEGA